MSTTPSDPNLIACHDAGPQTTEADGDELLRMAILSAVAQRGPDKTLCPSEVARGINPADWRQLMPELRRVAIDLAKHQRIAIRQSGVICNPDQPITGPIRLGEAAS
ncbi:MAG: DUF3253 domain-containing protein [Pseudomonadota bacterium]